MDYGSIDQLKQKSLENSITAILNADDINIAWNDRSMSVNSKEEVFYLLSCLNLLNSAIKRREYKNTLNYKGIKTNVSRLIKILLIADNSNKLVENFSINPDENNCAYIRSYGLQFTFHNISVDHNIRDFIRSNNNKIEKWEGFRLQKIANEIFEIAKKYKTKS